MAVNKVKLKTLNRLSDQGFDTQKKIMSIDMRAARDHGLSDDLGGIIDLQDAIRAHREIAYLCDGEDPKPRKEVVKNDRPEQSSPGDQKNQQSG